MKNVKFERKIDFKTPKPKAKVNTAKERKEAVAALIRGIQKGASRIESYLPPLLNKAMESKTWDWPNDTLRQNGSTAGRTRDIVDTGKLRDSLKVSTKFLKTKTTFNVTYGAPYAALVHEGGYILPYGDSFKDPKYIPGRPWVTAALEGGYDGITSVDIASEMMIGVYGEWG